MIMKETTKEALMELIKHCFQMNRDFDRMVSELGATFAYNNTSSLVHHGIAHYFPSLADEIGAKCLERYNISVIYGETSLADYVFDNVEDIIKCMCENGKSFQNLLIAANQIAFENGDLHIFVELQKMLQEYNIIVEQLILLEDKMALYKNNPTFDAEVDKFWILGD